MTSPLFPLIQQIHCAPGEPYYDEVYGLINNALTEDLGEEFADTAYRIKALGAVLPLSLQLAGVCILDFRPLRDGLPYGAAVLSYVVVAESFQGYGLGKRLMGAAEETVRANSRNRILLKPLDGMHVFYEKLGYTHSANKSMEKTIR